MQRSSLPIVRQLQIIPGPIKKDQTNRPEKAFSIASLISSKGATKTSKQLSLL